MKTVVVLLCTWLALAGSAVRAQMPQHVQLFGHDYVRLHDVSRAANLQIYWVQRDKVLDLTNRVARLEFTVNTAMVNVNGVNVWLSFPVVETAGVPCVSSLDWQTTLQPLLAGGSGSGKIRLVVLDPGHGGKDTGNRCGGENEKKYTLLLAQEIRDQLKKAGIKAILTRTTDTYVDLSERPAMARALGADLFISLHFNASVEDPRDVEGIETYCLTPVGASSTNSRGEGADSPGTNGNQNNAKNLRLAYAVHRSLTRSLDAGDRGVRRARFEVLRDAAMPAILIEGGYMSHPQEGRKIFSAAYRKQMAHAIVNGILAYQGAVAKPAAPQHTALQSTAPPHAAPQHP